MALAPQAAPAVPTPDVRHAQFVGLETCAECHADKAAGFTTTGHYLAMRLPEPRLLEQALATAGPTMVTRSEKLVYEFTRQSDQFAWTSVDTVDGPLNKRSEPVALVMGSNKMGLAFFYRQGTALFQMPVMYAACIDKWSNPPGYLDTWARWDRSIDARCLECHSTYFEQIRGSQNCYYPETAILSITCEKCHGPGSAHVAHHREVPDAESGAHIVNPARLSRARQLDVCAQCHGEVGQSLQPEFSYLPGEPLEQYMAFTGDEEHSNKVHTVNQTARLAKSACFQHSEMNCATCHDPHADERGNVALFSGRCLECHQVAQCGVSARLGDSIARNCVDCHMPIQDDQSLPMYNLVGDKMRLLQLRDHFVAVYPRESQAVEAAWNSPEMQLDPLERSYRLARQRIAEAGSQRAADLLAAGDRPQAEWVWRQTIAMVPHELLPRTRYAQYLNEQGRFGDAAAALEPLAEAAATDAGAVEAWGWALTGTQQTARAVAAYRQAVEQGMATPATRLRLAWLLATDADDALRNGAEALALVEPLLKADSNSWALLDTQAAALAELGRFDEAVAAAEAARQMAVAQQRADLVAESEERLKQFREGKPHRRRNLRAGDVK
ncbi:MAG: hypothetical protein K1X74_10520 [Pirellulales bacterium]|nr:hypothetical protein [Pirellulales bacterium]